MWNWRFAPRRSFLGLLCDISTYATLPKYIKRSAILTLGDTENRDCKSFRSASLNHGLPEHRPLRVHEPFLWGRHSGIEKNQTERQQCWDALWILCVAYRVSHNCAVCKGLWRLRYNWQQQQQRRDRTVQCQSLISLTSYVFFVFVPFRMWCTD